MAYNRDTTYRLGAYAVGRYSIRTKLADLLRSAGGVPTNDADADLEALNELVERKRNRDGSKPNAGFAFRFESLGPERGYSTGTDALVFDSRKA